MPKKILIIEDEKNIVQLISYNLQKPPVDDPQSESYECDAAYDGESGLQMALSGEYDLILLDIMLPKLDGFSVCREIRKTSAVPIIMVTAKEEEIDKITGLNIGADDYVTKPFSMNELKARIAANIRRCSDELQKKISDRSKNPKKITIRELEIDNEKCLVKKSGVPINLSKKEYDLLTFFAMNLEKVFSRQDLLREVWGYGGYLGDIRLVDVTIARLRAKIETNSEPEYIFTRREQGYYMQ